MAKSNEIRLHSQSSHQNKTKRKNNHLVLNLRENSEHNQTLINSTRTRITFLCQTADRTRNTLHHIAKEVLYRSVHRNEIPFHAKRRKSRLHPQFAIQTRTKWKDNHRVIIQMKNSENKQISTSLTRSEIKFSECNLWSAVLHLEKPR